MMATTIGKKKRTKMTRDEYKEAQNKWIDTNKISPGDRVRITRTAKNEEGGWGEVWVTEMNEAVGKIGVIDDFARHYGVVVCVDLENTTRKSFYYPYFVLELESEIEAPLRLPRF